MLCTILGACSTKEDASPPAPLYRMPASHTGVTFENKLTSSDDFNIIEYLYFYNGGGVAIGDINNDGLADIYFTANQGPNRLYLNKGNFQFEDITEQAGVAGDGNWSTGVSMADVNGDGYLDIFVCGVGRYKKFNGRNQLFINNGDLTFTEKTNEYGLAFQGFSTQAAFFDYDNDGDLDMYLLNHAVHTSRSSGDIGLRYQPDSLAGDKLYRNDLVPGGTPFFREVTSSAGIHNSRIGYGLGVAVSDVNGDGYPDIYIANDFQENDYLYINQGDGTFVQRAEVAFGHTSRFSMGTDIADINNDGLPDILTLDMLPKDEEVVKTTAGEDPYEIFRFKLRSGFHYQFARNTLQLHQGSGTDGIPLFSDIACLAGVEASDWSWSALLADFDNDGFRDIFVTNGIERRPNGLDYIHYISDDSVQRYADDNTFISKMPPGTVSNVIWRNKGDLTFEDVSDVWMKMPPSLSNGAAYGDLDNDGDLDLVVNNIDKRAWVFRNDLGDSLKSLTIRLAGKRPNTFAVGAKVYTWVNGNLSYHEVYPVRGWLSSVDYTVHVGLGNASKADSVVVMWPDFTLQRLVDVNAGSITVDQKDASSTWQQTEPPATLLTVSEPIPFRHRENSFNAFSVERLVPHMLSTRGPKLAQADVNGDGLPDVYIGGAAGQPGQLLLQTRDGRFVKSAQPAISADSLAEDTGCVFFDANGDGRPDLVVTGGGQQFRPEAPELSPRLYLNDGRGNFRRQLLIEGLFVDASCVRAADIDGDGDLDIFIGGRLVPGAYGRDTRSYLLINDGSGRFSDATDRLVAGGSGEFMGMVSDAVWMDVNGDQRPDLLLAGEWMPLTLFVQSEAGVFENQTERYGLSGTNGWWNTLHLVDLDGDGDMDVFAGNLGLNSRLRASAQTPVSLFAGDLDNNGSLDHILTYYNGRKRHPFASRDELVRQVPFLKRKYLRYEDYASVQLEDILDPDDQSLIRKHAYLFASVCLMNAGNRFEVVHLPADVQMFPVFAFTSKDVDGDGNVDVLAVGNLSAVQPELSRYDAGYGVLLVGDGNGGLTPRKHSGFVVRGEGRDMDLVRQADGTELIVVTRNDDTPLGFKVRR